MKGKVILCRCEDVTRKDVAHAIALGYSDIEEVKRYTGFGTGPCQGKECLSVIAALVAELTGRPPAAIPPFTARPPMAPTPLKFFVRDEAACYGGEPAAGAADEDGEDGGGGET